MPRAAPRPCSHRGCRGYALHKGYCDQHRRDHRTYDDRRGTATERGYDARWRAERKLFLAEHPWCAECERNRRLTPATVVDHIKPHKGDQTLFWDQLNWQPLCKPCHDRKTASEDMGAWPA